MIKQIAIIVQPGVTAVEPDEHVIKVSKGILSHVSIRPANGPNWEVYIRLIHMETPFIPNDNDEWIPLERIALNFYPQFSEWHDVYTVKAQICSPEARYPHTVQLELTIDEQDTTEQLLSRLIDEGL